MLTTPDQGWAWVVMIASFCSHFLSGGILFSVGTIHVSLLSRFNESVAKTSWAGSLYITFMCCGGIFASCLINKFNCRVASSVGTIIMTTGFVISSQVKSLDLVIIFYGCLAGVGSGIVYTSQLVALSVNFISKLNLAGGIATSGVGLGAFVISPVIQAARSVYGDASMFFIIAGISVHIIICSNLYFPSKLEMSIHVERVGNSSNSRKSEKTFACCTEIVEKTILFKNISFVFLCVAMFSFHLGVFVVFVHLVNYSIAQNSTEIQAAFLMSVNGFLSLVSRFLTGMAANAEDIDEFLILIGTFSLVSISTLLFPFYGKVYSGQILFSIFMGLYAGCVFPILNSVTVRVVGIAHVSTAIGLEMIFTGFGVLFGPPLAGYIVEHGGTYELSFVLAGCANLIGAFSVMFAYMFNKEDKVHTTYEITPPEFVFTVHL